MKQILICLGWALLCGGCSRGVVAHDDGIPRHDWMSARHVIGFHSWNDFSITGISEEPDPDETLVTSAVDSNSMAQFLRDHHVTGKILLIMMKRDVPSELVTEAIQIAGAGPVQVYIYHPELEPTPQYRKF